MNLYNKLIEVLSAKSEILLNESMKKHTTFKIGGNADCFVVVNSEEDLIKTISFAKENNVSVMMIGNGSNLLVGDNGIRGIVIKLGKFFSEVSCTGNIVTAGAGASLSSMTQVALENNLTGVEWAFGIPGTVGGAVFMNAGAYDGEMSLVVTETTYLSESLEVCTLSGKEHEFNYRKSAFNLGHVNGIILRTKVLLEKGNRDEIWGKMRKCMSARIDKQPLNMPSAGSVFKRPKDHFVGKMIDELGLKGYKVGGAKVSEKHGGFIVNDGDATASDVKKLIEYIKFRVKDKYNVDLEVEIREVGE